jgi:hypothetical protein
MSPMLIGDIIYLCQPWRGRPNTFSFAYTIPSFTYNRGTSSRLQAIFTPDELYWQIPLILSGHAFSYGLFAPARTCATLVDW